MSEKVEVPAADERGSKRPWGHRREEIEKAQGAKLD
jgi:hypothetical protein